jgi:UDP-4-amino-4,6-dideoxy-N-acetyl-beta-L-altrosamine transaminase
MVSSGTAALHIAALAAGIKEGDEVITTPISFVATSNCVLYAGAKPVFADIDEETLNLDPVEIEKKITKRTKAILPVHFAGLPCDMPEIAKIAKKHRLIVIEDACHALGAEYKVKGQGSRVKGEWTKVGSCEHSDMTVFSFHPVKAITTGEGGAVTTNDEKLYKKLIALRSHGTYKDEKTAAKGPWYYEMRDLGFNYRITDFQCALGLSQLEKLDTFIGRRKNISARYDREFLELGDLIRLPSQRVGNKRHAFHLYLLRLNLKKLAASQKNIVEELHKRNIGVQVHYIPIYEHPFYQKNGYGKTKCRFAEEYYAEAMSLPIYPTLKAEEQEYVINNVKEVVWKAAK